MTASRHRGGSALVTGGSFGIPANGSSSRAPHADPGSVSTRHRAFGSSRYGCRAVLTEVGIDRPESATVYVTPLRASDEVALERFDCPGDTVLRLDVFGKSRGAFTHHRIGRGDADRLRQRRDRQALSGDRRRSYSQLVDPACPERLIGIRGNDHAWETGAECNRGRPRSTVVHGGCKAREEPVERNRIDRRRRACGRSAP